MSADGNIVGLSAHRSADAAWPSQSTISGPGQGAPPGIKKRRGRLERIQNLVVAAALLAMLAAIIAHAVSRSDATIAATPEPLSYHTPPVGAPSGRQELLNLAAVAGRQPVLTTHAPYAYTKTRSWYVDARIGGGLTTTRVVPTTTESWLAPNGSGRVERVAVEPGGSPYLDEFSPTAGPRLLRESTDDAVLARQLANGHPTTDGPVEQFVALTDLAKQQPIAANVEAAILRLLARTPGLINSGTVRDRAGRPGMAVSLDSAYSGLLTRYTWIFDRSAGKLLGEEETLIGKPRKLNARKGSVLASTTFLTSGWVTNTSSRPASTN